MKAKIMTELRKEARIVGQFVNEHGEEFVVYEKDLKKDFGIVKIFITGDEFGWAVDTYQVVMTGTGPIVIREEFVLNGRELKKLDELMYKNYKNALR